tara:strand:- start:6940 stop:7140 length:201 start_codon:yes stop_codon:yes gene_type:complete
MKKVGLYLIITFSFYLLGQLLWILTIFYQEPLFGNANLELMLLVNIFNLSGIFGLISGFRLYQLNR